MSDAPNRPLTLLVVDDHEVVRQGLASMLDRRPGFQVIAEAGTVADSIELARRFQPDLVVMDIRLPDGSGIEACRDIRAEFPATRVVMLTSFREDRRVLDALSAGAIGFMLKDSDGAELVRAIEAAARGDVPLDPRAARAIVHGSTRTDPRDEMTAREREVLELISHGLPNKVIALRLGISEATVKAHLTRIYRHLGVSDRTQAAIWAREHPDTSRRDAS